MKLAKLSPPTLLTNDHETKEFDCDEPSLNEWLQKRALKNQILGASKCFVICHSKEVVGYYCLSAGAIGHDLAPKAMRRNMPDPLPVLLLGRLAIDKKYHNKGLGSAMLRDAMLRAVNVAKEAGVFVVLLHALTEKAKRFYLSRGFVESPVQLMTLMTTLETIRLILLE